jgi:rubrerythrin
MVKDRKDETLRILFGNIEEDEKRHHKIIQSIVKNLYKMD